MDAKQLRTIISLVEAVKSLDKSEDFNAGVAAAQMVINNLLQEAADRERMQKLEAELAELRAKYPSTDQIEPKKRGRRPKQITSEANQFETQTAA